MSCASSFRIATTLDEEQRKMLLNATSHVAYARYTNNGITLSEVSLFLGEEVDADMHMRVVVGINNTDFRSPLQWAIENLYRSGASIRAIHCIAGRLSTEMPYPNDEALARGQLVIEDAQRFAKGFGASVIAEVREGFAGRILVESSLHAGLLVVGSSRRRQLWHAPRASVVTYCVRQSKCPLAIVPASVEQDGEGENQLRA
jgi:nucleotide-binding universal stress UspA family protein